MNVTYGFLCDYATVSREGKLSIIGIFSDINVAKVPARHPQAFLAFELELSYAEVNLDSPMRIECVDEDGRPVFKMDGEVQVRGKARPGERPRMAQALQLNDLRFQHVGRYDINIFVNNELKRTVEFTVTQRSGGGAPDEDDDDDVLDD